MLGVVLIHAELGGADPGRLLDQVLPLDDLPSLGDTGGDLEAHGHHRQKQTEHQGAVRSLHVCNVRNKSTALCQVAETQRDKSYTVKYPIVELDLFSDSFSPLLWGVGIEIKG